MCVIVIRSQLFHRQGGLCGLAALYWALTDTLFTPSQVNLQICLDFFWGLLEFVLWTLTDTIYTLSLVNLLSVVVILLKIFIVIAIALFTPKGQVIVVICKFSSNVKVKVFVVFVLCLALCI